MVNLRWLDDKSFLQKVLLAEMSESVRRLYLSLVASPSSLALVRLLEQRANTLMSLDDLGSIQSQSNDITSEALQVLTQLGLTRRVELVDIVLFGCTQDLEKRQRIRELLAWQDQWFTRLERVKRIVEGSLM